MQWSLLAFNKYLLSMYCGPALEMGPHLHPLVTPTMPLRRHWEAKRVKEKQIVLRPLYVRHCLRSFVNQTSVCMTVTWDGVQIRP